MRRALLFALLLVGSCATAPPAQPGPVCQPRITTLVDGDEDAVLFGYEAALDALEHDIGYPRPSMCGIHVAVFPFPTQEALAAHCHTKNAEACVNVDPLDGFYLIRYFAGKPEHLRHEWLHIMLSELKVPHQKHHKILNAADIYYYPRGRNPEAK